LLFKMVMIHLFMTMSSWSVAAAKARLSELIGRAPREPQRITKRGRPVAVVVSPEAYEELSAPAARREAHPMKAFLETCARLRRAGDLDLKIPRRRSSRRRNPFG
jgi:prevent-host-death family protein